MVEQELKLTARDRQTLDAVLASDVVRDCCVSDPDAGPIHFLAKYYDTRDAILQENMFGLRARREGNRMRATFKMRGRIRDGLCQRIEYETDLEVWPKNFRDFPISDLRTELEQYVDLDTPLVERVRVDMQRRIRMLEIDGTLIELAADDGVISGLHGSATQYEIELELKEGSVRQITAMGAVLRDRFPLEPSVMTKLGIGLLLCQTE